MGSLRCFEAVSGLKINLSKSEIFQVGAINDLNIFPAILGCKIGCLPTSNLGLPLGSQFKSKVA